MNLLLALLPSGWTPEDALMLIVGLGAFAVVVLVWQAMLARDPMAGRARALAKQQEALRAGLLAPRRRAEAKPTAMSFMRQVTERLNLARSREADKIVDKLAQAGWRSKDAVTAYLFFKISLPFLFGGLALLLFYGIEVGEMPKAIRLLSSLAAVIVGAYAPEIHIRNAVQKRQLALRRALPDALDLMVICAEAGLSLDATLVRVAREMGRAAPELADELGLTSVELGFLPERRQALDNLNRRTDLAPVRGVVNTLIQTEKYGTPLAQSLRVLAAEFRNERMLKAEEKAARLPATLTVPMILFILPALFIVLLGPAIIQALDNFRGM